MWPTKPNGPGQQGEEPRRLPQDQRGGGGIEPAAARAALLGNAVRADPAAEAWRRPALLSPGRRRAVESYPASPVWRGLHDQRRAEAPEGARRQVGRHATRELTETAPDHAV